jgi:hypothetical protein
MKKLLLATGLCAALLALGCSSPATTNGTSNASGAANNANRASNTSANAANTAASPAASPAAANTSANTSAQPGGGQDFTLVNSTGVEIYALYVSPHNADDWEEDVLGRDTLPSGQTVDIKFNRDEKAAMWDLRVEDKDGNAIEWENLNLLEISKVTLHYENGKATAETE